jgi:hypothetical protein
MAESLRDIKQDIKQLNDGMMASFLQIGDAFTLNANNIEAVKQDVVSIKATMATKEDLRKLEIRFDKLESDVVSIKATMATKEDLHKLEIRFDKLEATQDLILQLLQQKSDK